MFDNDNDFSGDFDGDVSASERTPMLADQDVICGIVGGGNSGGVDPVDSVLPNVDDEQTWLIGCPDSPRSRPASHGGRSVTVDDDEVHDLDLTSLKLRRNTQQADVSSSQLGKFIRVTAAFLEFL